MKNSQKISTAASLFAAAALTGMLAGAANASGTGPVREGGFGASRAIAGTLVSGSGLFKAAHLCKGKNSCKGKGGCKTATHSCVGKNSCQGKGGCNTTMPKA